mmetsp:Transcript_5398/g.7757  ORF Transcript_5398/g.7757 Transcript_5398/m.7757 type:complete len:414 (-) Transcript_5398:3266-4507(-)
MVGHDCVAIETNLNEEDTAAEKRRPSNKLAAASCFSRLFFTWPYPLMRIGLTRTIEESDLPEILPIDSSKYNIELMDRIWKEEKERCSTIWKKRQKKNNNKKMKRPQASLHRAIVVYFLRSTWMVQLQIFLEMTARIVQALALGYLIEYFNHPSSSASTLGGYFWAGVVIVTGAIILLMMHLQFFATWRKGMQLRIAAIAAIYSKSLKLPSVGEHHTASSGQIINLATNDVERFLLACTTGSYLWWGPLQAIAVLIVGVNVIGPAFVAGYVLLFIFVLLQFFLGKRFAYLRSKVAVITDSRVNLLSQAISGVRVMKMSGWEQEFEERIVKVRQQEINQVQQANRLKAWNEALYFSSSVITTLIILTVHVTTGGVITERIVFTTLTLINIVQFTMWSVGMFRVHQPHPKVFRVF